MGSNFTAVRRGPPYTEVLYHVEGRIAWISMCAADSPPGGAAALNGPLPATLPRLTR